MANNKKIQQGLFFVGMLLLGLAVGYSLGPLLDNNFLSFLDLSTKDSGWPQWAIITSIFLVIMSVLAIHELGHLITGLLLGFKFQLLVVGPLGVKRTEEDKIRPYFNTNIGLAGGLAATTAQEVSPDNIYKFAKIVLAGPLTSLISVPIFFLLASISAPPWPFIFLMTSIVSFMIFLATTIPAKSGPFYSDRKRYQRLKGGGINQEIEAAFMKANTLKMTGEPLSKMDINEIEKIKLDDAVMMKYIGNLYEYEYYMNIDESKLPAIKERLDAAANELPKASVKLFNKELEKLETMRNSNTL